MRYRETTEVTNIHIAADLSDLRLLRQLENNLASLLASLFRLMITRREFKRRRQLLRLSSPRLHHIRLPTIFAAQLLCDEVGQFVDVDFVVLTPPSREH